MACPARPLALVLVAGCAGAPPPPEPAPPAGPPAAAAPGPTAALTCVDPDTDRGAGGMPAPLWTNRDPSTESLPCDRGASRGVHGVVMTKNGPPLACAKVRVGPEDHPLASTFTDASGCYVVPDLPSGRVEVQILFGSSIGGLMVPIPDHGLVRFDGQYDP